MENDQQKEKVEEKKEVRKVVEREKPSTHKQDVAVETVETVDDVKRFPSSSNDDFANLLAFLAKTLQIINTEINDDIILDVIIQASELFLNYKVNANRLKELIGKGENLTSI